MKILAALAVAAALGAAGPAFAETPEQAEATLRTTIAAIQSGSPNFDIMVPELVEAIKKLPDAPAQLAALGPVTAVSSTTQSDPFMYNVTFQNGAVLHWVLSFNDAGLIDGLQVQ
jgi:hypothetical protein